MARLEPAGIPGVESIELHERFRIVATVNDASIEDIVFPISEGLARRFVRIEMQGASEIEVTSFVCEAPCAVEPRATAAAEGEIRDALGALVVDCLAARRPLATWRPAQATNGNEARSRCGHAPPTCERSQG